MIFLDGDHLTIADVVRAVRGGEQIALDPKRLKAVEKARGTVQAVLEKGRAVYGINTGFGKLADKSISHQRVQDLQRNLILSHSSGVGDPLPDKIVRAMIMLRANALMKGYSGIRAEVIQLLVDMFNRGVIPHVPAQGSVGASGDLIPLAHMSAALIGEGQAMYQGEILSGAEALAKAGLEPVVLDAKEGLALINGTQYMSSFGVLGVYDAQIVVKTADIVGALTLEALGGLPEAFDPRVHQLRPHHGQQASAANIRRIISGSKLIYRPHPDRVQDAYSLRCIPQVHGASKDAISYAHNVIAIEINSVTDNPIIFSDRGDIVSAGNFHGQPIALTLDFLGIALAELASISERRIERLVNPTLSGLPPFLTSNSGLHSGYMITQYAAASLVSENKVLAHPAVVDSIPTSANQEDHVSMGAISARKMHTILQNVQNVLAIELLCACQGLEFADKSLMAPATTAVYDLIRSEVPPLEGDRIFASEINLVREMIYSGEILQSVEQVIGSLS